MLKISLLKWFTILSFITLICRLLYLQVLTYETLGYKLNQIDLFTRLQKCVDIKKQNIKRNTPSINLMNMQDNKITVKDISSFNLSNYNSFNLHESVTPRLDYCSLLFIKAYPSIRK